MRGFLAACGLFAALCGQAQQLEPNPAVTHSFRTTTIEEIAQRSALIGKEKDGKDAQHVMSTGTAYLYRQNEKYDFYATNHHIVTPYDCSTTFAIYNNGIARERAIELKLIYTDPSADLAILVAPKGEKTFPKVPILLDELDLGEQVMAVGYPASELREVVPGTVSSHSTRSVQGSPPIPGYQLYMAGFPGISGSGVFAQRKGTWHWAGLASSTDIRYPLVQITPARNFYSIAMSVQGDESLIKCR
jgi:S1-C subfamily serine protease